jgi:hypothetical protein
MGQKCVRFMSGPYEFLGYMGWTEVAKYRGFTPVFSVVHTSRKKAKNQKLIPNESCPSRSLLA